MGIQPLPVSFCPLRPPSKHKGFSQTCAYIPSPPPTPPASHSKFDWTLARMSADSPSLSADSAHDLFRQPWAPIQTPPTPPLFASAPLKSSLCPSVGALPRPARQQQWRQCSCVTSARWPLCRRASAGALWHGVAVVSARTIKTNFLLRRQQHFNACGHRGPAAFVGVGKRGGRVCLSAVRGEFFEEQRCRRDSQNEAFHGQKPKTARSNKGAGEGRQRISPQRVTRNVK